MRPPNFATAWGVSRQALEQAVQRGALFSIKHAGRRYYPRVLAANAKGHFYTWLLITMESGHGLDLKSLLPR